MNLSWSIGRGLRTGAVVGGVYAVALGLGAFGGPVLTLPFIVGAFATNTVLGAGIGAITFGTTHIIAQTTGLSRLFGDVPPSAEQYRQSNAKKRGNSSREQSPILLDETDSRNVGFRRQLEEQQQRADLYGQGR